jgi:hypothetical protein
MAINFAKFFRGLFGHTPPPAPKPVVIAPPVPQMRPIAVIAVNGAHVVLDGHPPFTGVCNADGYVLFPEVPESLAQSQLTVVASGYNPYSVHVDLPPGGHDLVVGDHGVLKDYQIQLPAMDSDHVNPSTVPLRDLARIRGAMWTVRGPWRFGPRAGQPDNITALEYIYAYGNDPHHLNAEQKAMIVTYKSFKYTHVCFGPINAQSYHGQYPDIDFTSPDMFEVWLDWLQMFWDNGLTPICFLHGDGQSLEQTIAMYDHLIRHNPRAQRLMRVVCPTGWEPTRYGWSSVTWAAFCQWAHDLLPNALILVHTEADVDACVGTDERFDDNDKARNPDGNAGGWARVCPHIHGWLVQTGAFADPDGHGDPNHPERTNFENWSDLWDKNVKGSYYDRFHNRYAGWPNVSLWGNEPIYIYAAEYCSYWEYWQNRPYAEGVKWGDRAITVGADGYLDSGSLDVPPAKG